MQNFANELFFGKFMSSTQLSTTKISKYKKNEILLKLQWVHCGKKHLPNEGSIESHMSILEIDVIKIK